MNQTDCKASTVAKCSFNQPIFQLTQQVFFSTRASCQFELFTIEPYRDCSASRSFSDDVGVKSFSNVFC